MTDNPGFDHHIELASDIVAAYVSKNALPVTELPALIGSIHQALRNTANGTTPKAEENLTPAVSVKKSVTPDYIISLETGQKFKSLKRHLTGLGMTPAQYREKWGLKSDYPMVSANYSASRSELAKNIGLGQKGRAARKPATNRTASARKPTANRTTKPTAKKATRQKKAA